MISAFFYLDTINYSKSDKAHNQFSLKGDALNTDNELRLQIKMLHNKVG